MKKLLLIILSSLSITFAYGQHHVVVTDINEAYDFYQTSHEGAETALHFISECFDCQTMDCMKENVGLAKNEAEAAMRNAHFAKDETHNAKSQASLICEVASNQTFDAHGSFHDAKRIFDIASTTLSTAHYSDDIDEMHNHLNDAIDHIQEAILHLNDGVDGLNGALGELEICKN
ncbi:hypothetical protein [Flammeovirga kamogawensis]|uniref:DUF4142 domain-containing protein n=1 Tax=Flammeovirga kamogawensis TaxID=373891 RepID=A0ABX8GZ60_9BACT|nr:hypothetical protein [Flammeovirga kamogawensis]MBB6459135.1 hypothetical protein [Flammeovirga kamogawensis]QWG08703.1 hypothetical protein KM029_07125 [Flammeovirga kamogawensis]TRX66996.1 hypothetical protein EO216_02170 [Flammeovirga kamogawensis]